MSRKPKAEKSGKSPDKGQVPFGNVKWVLNNLSKSELQDLDENPPQGNEVVLWVNEMIESGWRVSAKWDDRSKSVQVTFVQSDYAFPNAGYAFSSRSDDYYDCLTICWYKFVKVAAGLLSDFDVSTDFVRG